MDDIDQAILTILQKNARISNKQIADMVHLTPPAVTARIKRMENADVIEGYKAVVNAKKLNKALMARVLIKMDKQAKDKLLPILAQHKNIIGYEHVTGRYTLSVKVLVADIPELEKLLGKLQQYGTTETLLILSNSMANQPIYTLD